MLRSRAQRDHGARTHPPTFCLGWVPSFQLWSPADGSGEGRRLPEPGPGSVCVAGAGVFRDACVFFCKRVSVFLWCPVLCQLPRVGLVLN